MSVCIEVWGDYACFTRPEMKVERVSYDVMTPSAARGILDSIYWHPGMRWCVDRIHVLNPIRFTNIRRNELDSVISARNARTVMERKEGSLYLATGEHIQQRATMLLKDVRYVIEAHFEITKKIDGWSYARLWETVKAKGWDRKELVKRAKMKQDIWDQIDAEDGIPMTAMSRLCETLGCSIENVAEFKPGTGLSEGKVHAITTRRLTKGENYHQSCFGNREFPAYLQPCESIPPCHDELRGERDLGWMLLDMDYSNPQDIKPMFFRAVMKDGVIEVPRAVAHEGGVVV